MLKGVAIVGAACCYPDARSASELWENVLSQRQAFRRMPPERLRLEDYFSSARDAPDQIYSTQAAVIEGYEFDRLRFRVAGTTFRSTDPAHWMALDVANQALNDAGYVDAEGLPLEKTGVFVGNTLTGDCSRANLLRLRWPYVRRVVEASLGEMDWSLNQRTEFWERLESTFKKPFPEINEESLAGALSNTIAGRICNFFNFKGGGYVVDGACASSLLAVANACSALTAGDLKVALAGGVDLSLDPFELVGFAKAGALASERMRVYDSRSNGFWPGEGCGFVVLMPYEEAVDQGLRIYAVIKGWGISSDGQGGMTRPEIEGQMLALQRAYDRAGFGIDSVAYFEGHGTGTAVGDAVELQALSRARRQANQGCAPAAIGSIKALFGHTKAAAGLAGLLKCALALHNRIIPPTTLCEDPRAEFGGEHPALRIAKTGESWPAQCKLRAGVSSMGFGGINAHVALEGHQTEIQRTITIHERELISTAQDYELFLLSTSSTGELLKVVDHISSFAGKLSIAEMADLSATLAGSIESLRVRAALVASTPAGLVAGLLKLQSHLRGGDSVMDPGFGLFLGHRDSQPRIGFLFSGQASPANLSGGAWRRRFSSVQQLYSDARLDERATETSTLASQPGIVTASMAGLRVLTSLAISAEVAVGHSLGELTALHWARAIDEQSLIRLATIRAQAMVNGGQHPGGMLSLRADEETVNALINGDRVWIAALNTPSQTVVSGDLKTLGDLSSRARARGLGAVTLAVSHAFHSPYVAHAGPAIAEYLAQLKLEPLSRTVVSTITAQPLIADTNLSELLCLQLTAPVRFMEAFNLANVPAVDLWLEVGPGNVLQGLASEITHSTVISVDAGGKSLRGLLSAAGAAFVLGHPLTHQALFKGRVTKPFNWNWKPRFLVNPCELAPLVDSSDVIAPKVVPGNGHSKVQQRHGNSNRSVAAGTSILGLVIKLVAERSELPVAAVRSESRLLSDLHLNSITVGQLATEAAGQLNLPPPVSPTDFADATVAEIAQALEDQLQNRPTSHAVEVEGLIPGVDSWVRPFQVEWTERQLRRSLSSRPAGVWTILGEQDRFTGLLREKFASYDVGSGVVLCLKDDRTQNTIRDLLTAARLVVKDKQAKFVVLQSGWGAGAFARTLHLENPGLTTCVINLPKFDNRAADWVVSEALAAGGYVEVKFDEDGRRYEPVVRPVLMTSTASSPLPLLPNEVIIVSGGGKGITAECALALASETSARLALLGRAEPATDPDLSLNLKRLSAAGINFRYYSTDVTDQDQVRKAVERIEQELGPVRAILHGAARNEPRLVSNLDEDSFSRTIAVKVHGARNLLAAVDSQKLKVLVTFSSIIARTGLPGEADYGLANEWLTKLTESWKADHPDCQSLALEWSVWSGKGMGARLGTTDRYSQQGISPISPDLGVGMFLDLLRQPSSPVSVVVMSRFLDLPTFQVERLDLPLLRFLEQPKVFYPTVELIADTDLSDATDPYLEDHKLQNEQLLPAVMGLEAMAQAARVVAGVDSAPAFENVKFNKPLVVSEGRTLRMRVAALSRGSNRVDVAIRSAETSFQEDHFKATCVFDTTKGDDGGARSVVSCPDELAKIQLDPNEDLYGQILFHKGRFRRLKNYRLLKATECVAEILGDGQSLWFNSYLPATLTLGDPGQRDAALHAIQACIPHSTLLPVAVDRIVINSVNPCDRVFMHAVEQSNDGKNFVYDLSVLRTDGSLIEKWEGLRLRAVGGHSFQKPWPESLLTPYLQRGVQALLPGASVSIALLRDAGADRRSRSNKSIQTALDKTVDIFRTADGKPYVSEGRTVSAAHSEDLTLAVAGLGPVSCDLESVVQRSRSTWRDLLGEDRLALATLIAEREGEDHSAAATRVWTAAECLKKVGTAAASPLLWVRSAPGGWVQLAAGQFAVASCITQLRHRETNVAIAFLVTASDAQG